MIQHPMGHSRIHLKMSNLGGFYRKVSVSSAIHLANDQRRKDRYHISSLISSKRPIICFYTSNAMTVTLIIICSPMSGFSYSTTTTTIIIITDVIEEDSLSLLFRLLVLHRSDLGRENCFPERRWRPGQEDSFTCETYSKKYQRSNVLMIFMYS